MNSEPEILNVNVHEDIKAKGVFGNSKQTFINPNNDPKIAGLTQVGDVNTLKEIAQIAFDLSKEKQKPVIIIVNAR